MRKSSLQPVFSDKVVTTTELVRRVREITKSALRQPVTIHRPEGDLAMLRRSDVADMIAATEASETLLDFVKGLVRLLKDKNEPLGEWEWLQVFSTDDVADFLDEYASAIEQAMAGQTDLSRVGDVLHEWQESARAMKRQPLLAELAISRGLVPEEEAEQLSAEELRHRLYAAIAGNSSDG